MKKEIYFGNVHVQKYSINKKLVDLFEAVESLTKAERIFPMNFSPPTCPEKCAQVYHHNDMTLVVSKSRAGGKYIYAHGKPGKIKETIDGLTKKLKDAEWPNSSGTVQVGNTTVYLMPDLSKS